MTLKTKIFLYTVWLCIINSVFLIGGLSKASAMASLVVSQRDLGCQATEFIHLDEGLNTDDPRAADFWKLLGGKASYSGKRFSQHHLFLKMFKL